MSDTMKSERNSIPKLRPKRQPQVIDAEARDVTQRAEAPAMQDEPMAKKDDVKAEAAAEPAGHTAEETPKADARKQDYAAAFPAILVAALSGVGAGLLGAWLFASTPPSAPDTSSVSNAIAQLSSRLSQQETKSQPMIDLSPLNERNAKLESATGELRNQLAEVKRLIEAQEKAPAVATATAELRGELAQMKKLIEAQAKTPATPAASAAEVAAVNQRLSQIEARVVALTDAPKPQPAPEPKPDLHSAEVVALGVLRDAIASGRPFANELEAVRGIAKERAASLAPLAQHAKDGLPTIAMLARQFGPAASRMLSPPPSSDSGVLTRLWSNASKIVEVRPVGEPQGSEPAAIIARMDAKLSRADLAGALEDAKSLPASVRDLAKDWFAPAERRRDADALIRNQINAALSAIVTERPKP
ncbi:MAG TPA: hypothetical protein PL193_05365 [Xanthobacteraceae bacterium]|nr:hypothetical protein [Xanthobacteraceae bacterium]